MGQGMRRQNARLGRTISGLAEPPNLTGDPAGYDTSLFPNVRAIRRALAYLGYQVPINDQPLLDSTAVRRFQEDYNKAAAQPPGLFDASVPLTVNGKMDKASLNGLDHVLPYALDWRSYFRPQRLSAKMVDWGRDRKGYRFSGCGKNRCYPGIAVMGCGCGCKGGCCGSKGYRFSESGCAPYGSIDHDVYQCLPCAYYVGDNVGQGCITPAPKRDNFPGGGGSGVELIETFSAGPGTSHSGRKTRPLALSTGMGGYAARRQRARRSGRY